MIAWNRQPICRFFEAKFEQIIMKIIISCCYISYHLQMLTKYALVAHFNQTFHSCGFVSSSQVQTLYRHNSNKLIWAHRISKQLFVRKLNVDLIHHITFSMLPKWENVKWNCRICIKARKANLYNPLFRLCVHNF